MVGPKGNEVTRVLELIRADVQGEAFPGAGDLEGPEWERDAFHVLIATVLSQRTRDQNTYIASKQLFSRFDNPAAIASARIEEIEELIRPSGFYKVKAKGIQRLCRELVDNHSGKVPDDIETLMMLPLVGRKTANCVLSYGFGKDALCVDVHVHRISNRLGWVITRSPDATEVELRKKVPRTSWCDINRLLVRFGQKTCLPRNPRCQQCPVNEHCRYFAENFG